jgi:hypothetical protein
MLNDLHRPAQGKTRVEAVDEAEAFEKELNDGLTFAEAEAAQIQTARELRDPKVTAALRQGAYMVAVQTLHVHQNCRASPSGASARFLLQRNPRTQRLPNPFAAGSEPEPSSSRHVAVARGGAGNAGRRAAAKAQKNLSEAKETAEAPTSQKTKEEAVVARRDYDRMEEKLADTEEMLEEALAEAASD